jgi:hypothetical protein
MGDITNHYAGIHIAQVRVAFQIPRKVIHKVAPSLDASPFLAYVEWFSPLPAAPDPKHKLFKVTRMTQNGRRSASVIELDNVLGSVHLFPRFGATSPQEWKDFTVLELCDSFYINPFSCLNSYLQFT